MSLVFLFCAACRIPYIYDIIPQVPCAPTMAACKNTVVPTTNPNGTWPYAPVGGTITLLPTGMPSQSAHWAGLNKIFPCQLDRFVLATHICRCAEMSCAGLSCRIGKHKEQGLLQEQLLEPCAAANQLSSSNIAAHSATYSCMQRAAAMATTQHNAIMFAMLLLQLAL
jgi:hypothetical protein